MGWIIRDSSGSLVEAGCKQIKRRWTIKTLEILAIKEGLKAYLAQKRNQSVHLIVEADVLKVIRALNYEIADISESKIVMNEVEVLAAEASVISFIKCPRVGNQIARAAAGFSSVFSLSSTCFLNRPHLPCWKTFFF